MRLEKSAEEILKAFRTIEDDYREIGVKISNIVIDNGAEFRNGLFLNHFKRH